VRHRYLVRKDPTQPNHRHVLLVDTSMLADLAGQGIPLSPGMMGENIVVEGIAVMDLALGTRIEIGAALLEVTEIRTPCAQLNAMHPDLLETVAAKEDSEVGPKAGIFARILRGGPIPAGRSPVIVQAMADGLPAIAGHLELPHERQNRRPHGLRLCLVAVKGRPTRSLPPA
jgi:MOSC domain-containing protein YiiM